MQGPQEKPHWSLSWNAVAAVLGGVAALITACLGVATFIVATGDSGAPPAQAPAAGATTGSPAASRTGWTLAWEGDFLLGNNGVSFDHEPPRQGAGFDIYSGGTSAVVAGMGSGSARLAALPADSPATADACRSRVQTHGTADAPLDNGNRLCVQTARGRIALVVIVGARDGSLDWEATVTIWRPADGVR